MKEKKSQLYQKAGSIPQKLTMILRKHFHFKYLHLHQKQQHQALCKNSQLLQILHNLMNLLKCKFYILKNILNNLNKNLLSHHPPSPANVGLMMVANTTSFLKHDIPARSFSLGFSESSEEDTLTHEVKPTVEKKKSQESPILVEELEELNLALENHQGKFKQLKTNKPFDIQDYKDFILYLDKKKFVSHSFIFALVCYAEHWWIWMEDVKKKKFHVHDPFHKKSPSKERTTLNKFVGFMI
ncbi:hypothetical protein Ahy_A02g008088 [Arachis hypogaea]|uniref:Ubiquitin-like protease family profile domain-containing protein n=1 Tax=Arachis hypogaea TaxID=3818 RepID=A0A445EE05_ARAHY|nr:hypothetical protein Ahy_A02g008088 [Arachis hypogaea]